MRGFLSGLAPTCLRKAARVCRDRMIRSALWCLNAVGLNVARTKDYYSPLPVQSQLEANFSRWFRPSQLCGVQYNLDAMRASLAKLTDAYASEFLELPPYSETKGKGYGAGFTAVDAMMAYFMVRVIKPRRYIEVGSGLSTYYSSLAAAKNAQEGRPVSINCIEPFRRPALYDIPGIEVIKKEAQDVAVSVFEALESGDILFLDSTHVLKVGGEVAYLFLEILPRLKAGVTVHVHDAPFPYNVPYPPERWILGRTWPVYWNEAMMLQAFLCFNNTYEIVMSTPLLRFHDVEFLRRELPGFDADYEDRNPSSSLWMKRAGATDPRELHV